MNRHQRQMQVPEIGPERQARLSSAHVLVVGAGGLGSTVLPVLAGAGVGTLTLLDHDVVELSNLHRQPLYKMDDLGKAKALCAKAALLAANPEIDIRAYNVALDAANAAQFVSEADLVIDAADSFAVTYILSDHCARLKKPLVSASVVGLGGYAGLFCGQGPSYRAVFPLFPETAQSCSEAGVLGSAVAIVGALEAHIALHFLLALSPPQNRLLSFDGLLMGFGGFDFSSAAEPLSSLPFVTRDDVMADDVVVDVRGLDEAPVSPFANAIRVLPDDIGTLHAQLDPAKRIVLCCRSGLRAGRAAQKLQSMGMKNLALVALGQV